MVGVTLLYKYLQSINYNGNMYTVDNISQFKKYQLKILIFAFRLSSKMLCDVTIMWTIVHRWWSKYIVPTILKLHKIFTTNKVKNWKNSSGFRTRLGHAYISSPKYITFSWPIYRFWYLTCQRIVTKPEKLQIFRTI